MNDVRRIYMGGGDVVITSLRFTIPLDELRKRAGLARVGAALNEEWAEFDERFFADDRRRASYRHRIAQGYTPNLRMRGTLRDRALAGTW